MSLCIGETLEESRRLGNGNAFRVAIVGGGPRGLQCLECLAREFAACASSSADVCLDVTIYEPTQHLGAGNVYAPGQPPHLRMNFAAAYVHAWSAPGERSKTQPEQSRPSLVEWLQQHHPDLADPNAFVPRGVVGEYLTDCFRQQLATLPVGMHCRIVHSKVHDLHMHADGWRVIAGGQSESYDEVMVTTGHEGWRSADKDTAVEHARISHIYPVERQLNVDQLPPAAQIACRGFGLTWIDAALSLTEGRGGRFTSDSQGWHYQPSGLEPAKLFPFSRSGRPMLAKPLPNRALPAETIERLLSPLRQRLAAEVPPPGGFQFEQELCPRVFEAADLLLQQVDQPTGCAAWFADWCSRPVDGRQVLQWMQTSYATATGQTPPDAAWALGHAWRGIYSALVNCINHGGLAATSWREFSRIAVEMERIAFGPPAENLGRVLALVDAGIVDLCCVAAPQLRSHDGGLALQNAQQSVPIQYVVEATIPAAGQFAKDSLLGKLLKRGVVHRLAGTQGIAIDRQGRPLAAHEGGPVAGLAILGRATEGCVLGNDTLSRQLHRHADRWAEMLGERIRQAACVANQP